MTIRAYRVLLCNPTQNIEWIDVFHASSYSEALTMAERRHAGIADVLIGIPADCYDLARREGIRFNAADGLLTEE